MQRRKNPLKFFKGAKAILSVHGAASLEAKNFSKLSRALNINVRYLDEQIEAKKFETIGSQVPLNKFDYELESPLNYTRNALLKVRALPTKDYKIKITRN